MERRQGFDFREPDSWLIGLGGNILTGTSHISLSIKFAFAFSALALSLGCSADWKNEVDWKPKQKVGYMVEGGQLVAKNMDSYDILASTPFNGEVREIRLLEANGLDQSYIEVFTSNTRSVYQSIEEDSGWVLNLVSAKNLIGNYDTTVSFRGQVFNQDPTAAALTSFTNGGVVIYQGFQAVPLRFSFVNPAAVAFSGSNIVALMPPDADGTAPGNLQGGNQQGQGGSSGTGVQVPSPINPSGGYLPSARFLSMIELGLDGTRLIHPTLLPPLQAPIARIKECGPNAVAYVAEDRREVGVFTYSAESRKFTKTGEAHFARIDYLACNQGIIYVGLDGKVGELIPVDNQSGAAPPDFVGNNVLVGQASGLAFTMQIDSGHAGPVRNINFADGGISFVTEAVSELVHSRITDTDDSFGQVDAVRLAGTTLKAAVEVRLAHDANEN